MTIRHESLPGVYPVEQTALLYKEGPRFPRLSGARSPRTRRSDAEPGGERMWGLLVNPTALIPLTEAGDLQQDRVGQLIKRVLDSLASDETCRAYSHALEMFLAFCGREGNPTLSAELVASYRVLLVGEGKSSSTVGVHLRPSKLWPGRRSRPG